MFDRIGAAVMAAMVCVQYLMTMVMVMVAPLLIDSIGFKTYLTLIALLQVTLCLTSTTLTFLIETRKLNFHPLRQS